MSLSEEAITTLYPLPVYHYLVRIGGLPFSFREVSGLTQQYDKAIYRHGLSFKGGYNIVRGLPQPVSVTLRRGIFRIENYQDRPEGSIAGQAVSAFTDAIFRQAKFTMTQWLADNKKRDIIVHLIDHDGNEVVTWTLVEALPLKVEAPSLDAERNEIAIEAIEVIGTEVRTSYTKRVI